MTTTDLKAIIEATKAHIRNTDATEDEYLQGYLQGMEDALKFIEQRS